MIFKWNKNSTTASKTGWELTSKLLRNISSIKQGLFTILLLVVGIWSVPTNLSAQESDSTSHYSPFTSGLSYAQITAFGDISVKEALYRVPGMQVSRDGDLNFRGAGFNTLGVTVNGQRLANTGLGTRDFNLGSISTDAIRKIEITKVLDPSMSADALAGNINLVTNSRLQTEQGRTVSALLGGGGNTKFISRTGPNNRGWINYTERYSDELAVGINLSFQQDNRAYEGLGLAYGVANIGNEDVNVINRVSPSITVSESGHFSTSFEADYTPSDNDSYFVKAFFNSNDRIQKSHRNSWVAGGGWTSQTTAEGEQGSYSHEAGIVDVSTNHFTLQAGGANDFEDFTLSYDLGWSQSDIESQDYLFPFQLDGLNYSVDIADWNRPQMTITNREQQVLDDGTVDRQFMIGQDFERILQEHTNRDISARVDAKLPIEAGYLKGGASVRISSKEGEYDENHFEYNRTLRMISFNLLREPTRNIDVINDAYRIPWFVNTSNARAFLETQRPLFTGDPNLRAYRSEIMNYESEEQIYSAYGMADLTFGSIEFTGGLRMEYTFAELTGNEVYFDDAGVLDNLNQAEETNSGVQLFPNAQVGMNLTENTNIWLAYSKTTDRPDYIQQTPFGRYDAQNLEIYAGNNMLDPVLSNNFDLEIGHRFNSGSNITLAGFYKTVSNSIVLQSEVVSTGGEFSGYDQMIFQNSESDATIYGAEVAVNQSLSFLPGIFGNFGLFGNYTWSDSQFETNRGELALQNQSPHVVNAALNYTQNRFKAQVSYHWTAELVTDYATVQQLAPYIASGNVYLDTYEEGYQDLSATAEYQLSERFKVWLNGRHLISDDQNQYLENETWYPTSTYIRSGLDLRIGVRFDL